MSKYAHTLKEVPLGKMTVLPIAQREYRQHRVDHLLRKFDVNKLGYIVVSERDGSYHIIEGQHRWRALCAFLGEGWEQQKLKCIVHSGLNDADEAEMFLSLNDKLTVSVADKFNAAVTAGRPTETAVVRVVKNQGLKIGKHRTSGAITAVGVLCKVLERSDEMVLGRSLRIIRDAYGETGLESHVIDGMSHLCLRYNGSLDEQHAKEKLGNARGGVKGLLNRAADLRLRTGNSLPICIAASAVDIINSGRGGGKKIPSWWAE